MLIDGVRYKADIQVDGYGSDAAFLTDLTIRFNDFESDDETTARSSPNSRRYVAESISTPHRLTLRDTDENEAITAVIDWTGGGLIDDRSVTWSTDGKSLTVSELSQDYNLPNVTLGQTFDFPNFCREVLDAFIRLLWPACLTIAFVLASTSKYLWNHTRRNSCNKCGYNCHGIHSPRCPECGAARDAFRTDPSVPDEADA